MGEIALNLPVITDSPEVRGLKTQADNLSR